MQPSWAEYECGSGAAVLKPRRSEKDLFLSENPLLNKGEVLLSQYNAKITLIS